MVFEIVRDSIHAIFHERDVEVEQESKRFLHPVQVRSHLRVMHRRYLLYRFQFNHKHAFHEEIEPVRNAEVFPLIEGLHLLLAFNTDAAKSKLMRKSVGIGAFQ